MASETHFLTSNPFNFLMLLIFFKGQYMCKSMNKWGSMGNFQNILLSFQGTSDNSRYVCQRFASKIWKKNRNTPIPNHKHIISMPIPYTQEQNQPTNQQTNKHSNTMHFLLFPLTIILYSGLIITGKKERKTLIISNVVRI